MVSNQIVRKPAQGIALIQVLLMVAIMSLIAIHFAKGGQSQISVAKDFDDRLQAELNLRTSQSRLLFEFFGHDAEDLSDKTVAGVKWNLRNTSFEVSKGALVEIQALSGLVSLVTAPPKMLKSVLREAGASEAQVQEVVASIQDWIDVDDSVSMYGAESGYYNRFEFGATRNGPLQHISELDVIKGMTPELARKVKPLFSVYAQPSFNPTLAPVESVRAIFGKNIARQAQSAQQQGKLTDKVWRSIVGNKEFEFIDTHPRSLFRIRVKSAVGDVRLSRTMDILVQSQKARQPIIILARS